MTTEISMKHVFEDESCHEDIGSNYLTLVSKPATRICHEDFGRHKLKVGLGVWLNKLWGEEEYWIREEIQTKKENNNSTSLSPIEKPNACPRLQQHKNRD